MINIKYLALYKETMFIVYINIVVSGVWVYIRKVTIITYIMHYGTLST